MRASFVQSMLKHVHNPSLFLLAGDLGYNVLEPLEAKLGQRFCNAGIAEQNMLGVAAGLASDSFLPFVYSISPFIYARAFEQLRNDIAFHNLPVCLIGSGAGFGYGVNGPTHFALEDCALVSTLPNINLHIPCFAQDLEKIINNYFDSPKFTYIRLARHETAYENFPEYQPYRKILSGNGTILLVLGSIAGVYYDYFEKIEPEKRPSIWCCSKLPVYSQDIPEKLLQEIHVTQKFCIVEDHIRNGGLGEQFLYQCMIGGVNIKQIKHLHASSTYSSLYGSQDYLRELNMLTKNSVNDFFKQ